MQIPTKEDFEALSRKIDALRQDLQGATIIPAPEWVCIKEAARRKGVTEDTIRRWIRCGRMKARGSGRMREVHMPSFVEARDEKEFYKPSRKMAEKVFKRDGRVCRYCKTTEGPFQIDHVTPWSRGGKTLLSNLAVCCPSCNSQKGNKLLSEWGGPKSDG